MAYNHILNYLFEGAESGFSESDAKKHAVEIRAMILHQDNAPCSCYARSDRQTFF